jgi:cyclopropane fatty-acyl-phospholipid synthase-like methyltransferase
VLEEQSRVLHITDKMLEWGYALFLSHSQQIRAAQCAAVSETSYAVGLLHGEEMLLFGCGK